MLLKLRSRLSAVQPSFFLLILAVLLGGYIRLAPVLYATFPLNDGGLFFTMTQDLVENGFKLPQFTTYNRLQIPFAYPPLGFYLSGGLYKLTGLELLDIFRILPSIFSILTIPAFYLLANVLLEDDTAIGFSVLIFSFIPIDYEWFLMGGGITRAPGFFFSLIALYFGARCFIHGKWFDVLPTAVFSSIAVLLHPEAAVHTAIGLFVFLVFKGLTKKGLKSAVIILLAILLLTCPWWINVITDHGIAPFSAAKEVGVHHLLKYVELILFNFTGENGLTSIAFLAFLGIFISIRKKEWLLPVWLILAFLIAQRGEIIALLAGITLTTLFKYFDQTNLPQMHKRSDTKPLTGNLSKLFFSFLLIQWIYSGITVANNLMTTYVLSASDVSAMEWVKESTPAAGKFLVLSGLHPLLDPVSEWFPTLTNHQSVATIQGKEWVSQFDFDEERDNSVEIQNCILQDLNCVSKVSEEAAWDFDYIFLRKFVVTRNYGNLTTIGLSNDFAASSRFSLVYETDTIFIFKVNGKY